MSHYKRLFDQCNPPAKDDTCSATIWCRTLLRIGVAEALEERLNRPKRQSMQHLIDEIAEEYEIFLMHAMGRVEQDAEGRDVYQTLY